MKIRHHLFAYFAGCATMALGAAAVSPFQDTATGQDAAPGQDDMMALMAEYGAPGPEHEALIAGAGEWTADMKHYPAPGAPAMEMSGKTTIEPMFDGRYMLQHMASDFMGMPYEGAGLSGYDRVRGKYFSIWIDSMSTSVTVVWGDREGDTITYKGKMPDPMAGGEVPVMMKHKEVSDDHVLFTMHTPGPDGKPFKSMQIDYKRN